MSLKQTQWQVFDLVEAFQLSQAMAALHELGVLAALTTPCRPKELAKRFRSRVRASGLSARVRFIQADCRNLRGTISASRRARVSSLACNVANEMFKDGPLRAVKWLRGLRRLFPDRPLLILDYYGRLGQMGQKKTRLLAKERETILHDFAQLISGQVIPPASAAEWRVIYAEAGCRLVHISEDKLTTRFIHILRL